MMVRRNRMFIDAVLFIAWAILIAVILVFKIRI